MDKKLMAIACSIALVLLVSACKQKEPSKPIPKAPVPAMTRVAPMEETTQIVVPDTVKGKWIAVKIIVQDKATKKSREYTINLNSDFIIPNSDLKIHVGEFLPDFKKDGNILTSASNNPNNPAVAIRVFEGDKQIFPTPGKQWRWLFSKLPDVHPLNHPRYGLVLKEGIPGKG
ncbi:MAG: DUF2155 domain-containing protein [Nitrospira sp.]|nr:DUF2155 domain-containing protein [Nitrospira sp.]